MLFSQHARPPATRPIAMPMSGRCPSMNQDSTAATAGMTANSIVTAAAPCTLMART